MRALAPNGSATDLNTAVKAPGNRILPDKQITGIPCHLKGRGGDKAQLNRGRLLELEGMWGEEQAGVSLSPHPGPTNRVCLQQVCCERSIRKP